MKRLFSICLLTTMLVSSCNVLDDLGLTGTVEIENVTMTAHDFILDNDGTRTSVNFSSSGANFVWSEDDVVGVFPNQEEATQVKFPISDGNVEGGTATSSANFSGKGWAVMKANTYAAYYPFESDMDLDKTAIPVTYNGQKQNGNGNVKHISDYDYMAAAPTEPTSNGNIGFDFKHLGSLFQFVIPVPKKGTYKTLTLKCEDVPFVTEGHVDITSANPQVIADECDNCFVIELENIETKKEGENLIINVLLPPVDMSGHLINVRLQGPNADFETSFTPKNPFKPGTAYRPNLPAVEGGDVVKIMNGIEFNKVIKGFVNNDTYLYEKPDYKIKSIVFEPNTSTEPTDPFIDVSDPSSPQPIYAMWDETSGTLTMRTSAYKIYANEDASGMFNELRGLTNFTGTGFNTTFTTRISEMFKNCVEIKNLDLSMFETENIVDMSGLFESCESLSQLNISSFVTEKTSSMFEMFKNCRRLEMIDLSHFDLSTLYDMSGMFEDCSRVKNIIFNQTSRNSTVERVRYAFGGCSQLTSLDLSWLDTSNVGNFGYLFAWCENLTTIKGEIKVTDKTYEMIGMYAGCKLLKTIDTSNWDLENCVNMSGVFGSCSSLKILDVSNWNTSKVELMDGMFNGCTSLTTLDVSKWNTSSVTDMSLLFSHCSALAKLDVSKFNTSNNESFYMMFGGCSNLKIIDVSNFDTRNASDFRQVFWECSSLTSLNCTGWNTEKATTFDGMFTGCSSLDNLNIRSFKTSNCSNFNYMFGGCSKLQNIDLTNFDTRNANYMWNMFGGCSSLTALDLSSFDTSHVIEMGGMFSQCTNLKQINWGTKFDTHYCTGMQGMFDGSGFETLDLSHFKTSDVQNMSGMFSNMPNLTTLNISTFTTQHTTEMGSIFSNSKKLANLNLGENFRLCDNAYEPFDQMGSEAAGTKTIRCSADFMNSDADDYIKESYTFINASTGENMTPSSLSRSRRK